MRNFVMADRSIRPCNVLMRIMKRVVLLRHGESVWNRENRFTGWTDVDLTERGVAEAVAAGHMMSEAGLQFGMAFTSYLKRAVKTLNYALDAMNLDWIPVEKSWRLNEKHYGFLQGLEKRETAVRYGKEQVHLWRRGYDVAPAPLEYDDPRHPRFDRRYRDVPAELLPATESLKDTVERVLPYWQERILEAMDTCGDILVAAHGNSLRAVVKVLKGISDNDIADFNLPTGTPYVFEFDDDGHVTGDYFLGDSEEVRRRMEQVAGQAG